MNRLLFSATVLFFVTTTLPAQCVKGDCANAYGAYIFKDGSRYEGYFRQGKPHGQGIFEFANGHRYVGTLAGGKQEGRGKFTYKQGHVYIGDFRDNRFHGVGETTYTNGDVHNGEYRNHQPNGAGKYTYANGNRYEGNFQNGRFEGTGTMFYADGGRYEGNWSNNKKHGRGTLYHANGTAETANWTYGQSGTHIDAAVAAVKPTAPAKPKPQVRPAAARDCNAQHCASGQGQYRYGDGSRFVGSFRDGAPHGEGILYYANGNRFEGGWQNHSPEGEGVMYYANGRVLGGVWERGKYVRETVAANDDATITGVRVDKHPAVKVWAVIVGVGRYEHMRSLRFTDDDAYQFYAHLRSPEGGAVPSEQLSVLIDEEATRVNILKAMQRTLLRADENDVIMFYFSGHGLAGSFLPVDFNGYENRLLHTEIKDVLERSGAKHKIVIADACYSGSLMASKTPFKEMSTIFNNEWNRSRGGLALLMSSKEEEVSLEDGGLRSGVFSHYLIRGLDGGADTNQNGIVTIWELFNFVKREVRDYTNSAQNPTITGNYDQNMPVAVLRR